MILLTNAEIKSQVDYYLNVFFARKVDTGRAYGQSYQVLVRRMQEFMLRGGKRLRPYLVYLSYSAASGADIAPVAEVLAATEFLHFALLIHDDIIDQDTFRYGGPNISGKYRQGKPQTASVSQSAEAAALLAGDLALSYVYELLAEAPLDDGARLALVSELGRQFEVVLAGQFLDSVHGELSGVRLQDILRVNLLKTASYSTSGPLKLGLILSGQGSHLLEPFVSYGDALGVLFALTDDLIGMFEVSGTTGKPSCSDLHEGKLTALFYYARKMLKGGDLDVLNNVMGKPHRADENLDDIRRVLIASGAKSQIQKLAQDYCQKATDALTGLQGPAVDRLRTMPEEILHRKR
ncbi:MAG TPA: polyprenyl synthetase family protein [Candidatus Saccharimonadia bacterium]|nr:polyprenyl synthetase family protein [Candidatus Saccharimonadia bacterium]